MSLAISSGYTGYSTYEVSGLSQRLRSNETGTYSTGSSSSVPQGQDRVELSDGGRIAVSCLLNGIMLPTEENVRKLSADLSRDLGSLLTSKGISAQPPIEFGTGPSGEIVVKGDRTDKEQILAAVNGDAKVAEKIRTVCALASHAAGMAESLKFQKEYMASNDPEGVVAKYAYLFTSQRSHEIGLVYDGSNVSVLSDGHEWLSSES